MYWHGLTKDGRPVFWIRTERKYWYPNVPAELNALLVRIYSFYLDSFDSINYNLIRFFLTLTFTN